ncbi:hypothetical protein ACFXDI_52030 [Streptomyces mirabilis]
MTADERIGVLILVDPQTTKDQPLQSNLIAASIPSLHRPTERSLPHTAA